MRIEVFLAELIEKKIHIASSNGELSVKVLKGNVDPATIQMIRERKQEIVAYLEGLKGNSYEAIPILPEAEAYPISDGQRRLYVLSQMDNNSTLYQLSNTVFFKGDFDRESFTKAVHETVNRHESLRTVFREDQSGEVKQWIIPPNELNLQIEIQQVFDPKNPLNAVSHVESYIEQDGRKGFDLENGPLIRATVIQYGADEYLFYYVMHHIICDGWSLDVLENDVLNFYEAFRSNATPTHESMRIQYKDYASWQLNQLESKKLQESRSFWLKRLEGDLPLLDLPSPLKRPRVKTSEGRKIVRPINSSLTHQIRTYSNENGGSLFVTAFACFNLLLYRYTAQTDLIIGTPVAGRNHPDLENQIGFYVNTLALRNELDPEDTFNDFYQKIKEATQACFNHQMYPFDRLVEELNLQRNSSRSAVFDVFFTVDSSKSSTSATPANQPAKIMEASSKFDLEIILQEFDNSLSLYSVFNPAVYEQEMVAGLLQHFEQLLKATLTSPQGIISEINYLSQEEEQELLFTFNHVRTERTEIGEDFKADEKMSGQSILDLFEEQVENHPDRTALYFSNALENDGQEAFQELSYKQLNDVSNRLANYLRAQHGVQKGDFITVLLERSEWLIISAMAILKLGATYVPVDPEYPEKRVAFIVEDSKSKLVVNEPFLETFKREMEGYSTELVKETLKPHQLAYVIYTSGSTGTPKGVMIQHDSLSSFFESCSQTFNAIPEIG